MARKNEAAERKNSGLHGLDGLDGLDGLHVPEAPARPGDKPDFAYLGMTDAAVPERPENTCDAAQTHPGCAGLIRVLHSDGAAKGPWNPGCADDLCLRGLAVMLRTRAYDDKLMHAQRQGKTSFYMRSKGEEACSVAATMALDPGDLLFPSYRQQGALLARGRDMTSMMCHCLSNTGDNLKGRQLPVHYCWAEGNVFSVSGNLATQCPQAVGAAMAARIQGRSQICATWIGDGASAEGDFHAACILAKTYKAPVILLLSNNQWAISMFQHLSGGEDTPFAARAIGYGIAGLRVDGNDFCAVYSAVAWAAERARGNHGPTLIELVTYRADSHSTSDDPSRYRPANEAHSFPLGDPVERLKKHLISTGALDKARYAKMEAEAKKTVDQAFAKAQAQGTLHTGPRLDPRGMFDDVFAVMPAHLKEQRDISLR